MFRRQVAWIGLVALVCVVVAHALAGSSQQSSAQTTPNSDGNGPVVSITAVSASVNEGNPAVFIVKVTSGEARRGLFVRVNVTSTGKVTAPNRVRSVYVAPRYSSGWTNSARLSVFTVNDVYQEPDGTITAALLGPSGPNKYTVSSSNNTATVNVLDNEVSTPRRPILTVTSASEVALGSPITLTVHAEHAPTKSFNVFALVRENNCLVDDVPDQHQNWRGVAKRIQAGESSVTFEYATSQGSCADGNDATLTFKLLTRSDYNPAGANYLLGIERKAVVTVRASGQLQMQSEPDSEQQPQQQQTEPQTTSPDTSSLETQIQARIDHANSNGKTASLRVWQRALAAVRGESPPSGTQPMTEAIAQRFANGHASKGRAELSQLWQDIADALGQ